MKVLNRLGIVAFTETLKRTIQCVSQDRKRSGIKSLLVDRAFTIASADNIDFLQSNAAVYSGSQHRSWHATSIQLVQPMPQTALIEPCTPRRLISSEGESSSTPSLTCTPIVEEEASSNPTHKLHLLLSRKRHECSSPASSPHQLTRSPSAKSLEELAHLLKLPNLMKM